MEEYPPREQREHKIRFRPKNYYKNKVTTISGKEQKNCIVCHLCSFTVDPLREKQPFTATHKRKINRSNPPWRVRGGHSRGGPYSRVLARAAPPTPSFCPWRPAGLRPRRPWKPPLGPAAVHWALRRTKDWGTETAADSPSSDASVRTEKRELDRNTPEEGSTRERERERGGGGEGEWVLKKLLFFLCPVSATEGIQRYRPFCGPPQIS